MHFTTRRVSFSIGLALIIGWGIFFLLFLASSRTLFESQISAGESMVTIPPGVNLSVQTDKKIYIGGDTVLIAMRNDSRTPIWIQEPDAACPNAWWSVERLQDDGQTWQAVQWSKTTCPTGTIVRFPGHTLKTAQWQALVLGTQIGEVLVNPPAGTYRVSMPYLKGKTITATTWDASKAEIAVSPSFTIQ